MGISRLLSSAPLWGIAIAIGMSARSDAAELSPIVHQLFQTHCFACHAAAGKSGGLDLERLTNGFDPKRDLALWVKVESAIRKGQMPPEEETPLGPPQIRAFEDWFETEFVKPGGKQHAGPRLPRRLTREELQNSLEDILHVAIREDVTNSRLHVIPETVIEKFFSAGVLGPSGFSNDARTLSKESIDIQTYARCFSLVLSLWDSHPSARKQVLGHETLPPTISREEAKGLITKFGTAAFRRKMTDQEIETILALYAKSAETKSAYEAIKTSFLAILLSPPFLYRFEAPAAGPVVGDELAVRLSYFLWSSPPDETLRNLARSGKLRERDVLKAQVRRMLADPKRIALAENLGGEWFGYKKLRQQSAVNKRSDKMAGFYRTQYEEALLFFDSVIQYDQSIFCLVDADWAFLNPHQASIYGIRTGKKTLESENVLPPINIHYRDHTRQVQNGNYEYKHAPLTLVQLEDPDRGGFITLGPTLSVTSTENRTSPIRRGVWVLEKILGEHFEVPQDVPDLEATQKKAARQNLNLSPHEILKLHSAQPGCAACHKYIDPIGFGLEAFDQLGVARNSTPVAGAGETLHWTPQQTPRTFAERSWKLSEPLKPDTDYRVHFQWKRGRHRLDIKHVRLVSGETILRDDHSGFTGSANSNNVWKFSLPATAPKSGWQLVADVKGDGGTDSHGEITVFDPKAPRMGLELPNGQTFHSPAELKTQLLSGYREQITENMIRRVLAYALGRSIEPVDRPAIQDIRKTLEDNQYRMTALIEAVVLSYPFLQKASE